MKKSDENSSENNTEDMSVEILKDLLAQGFEDQDLIREFQRVRSQIRPAIEKLIAESNQAAQVCKEMAMNKQKKSSEI